VKKLVTLGLALMVFAAASGCTHDGAANPKPANPKGNPGLKPDAVPKTNQQKQPSGAVPG
jgi:hypothetical protein